MSALNIGGSAQVKPFAKFNAKADKWFVRGDDGDVEIARPTFAADLANIRTGWLRFREGEAPERVIDPSLDRAAPNPGEGFKRGFVLSVLSRNFFGGLVELSSASIHMGNAIREVYQIFESQRESHPGQVPVLACTGSEPMKDRYGVNYKPRLELAKWIDRPAELPDESPVDASEVWQGGAVAPKAPAAHVPPPQAAPTPPPSAPAPRPAADPMLEAEF